MNDQDFEQLRILLIKILNIRPCPSDSDDADIIDVDFISEKQKRIMSLVYDCCIFLAKVVFLTFVFLCLLRLLKNYLLQ